MTTRSEGASSSTTRSESISQYYFPRSGILESMICRCYRVEAKIQMPYLKANRTKDWTISIASIELFTVPPDIVDNLKSLE